jgi:acetyl-CoA carboxylase carboxyl transferase subunit alpha
MIGIRSRAIYSVISPEGCAAILWKTAMAKDKAAQALRLTAADLSELGIIDEVVPEPVGGAQADWDAATGSLRSALVRHLAELDALSADERRVQRWDKYYAMGAWREV